MELVKINGVKNDTRGKGREWQNRGCMTHSVQFSSVCSVVSNSLNPMDCPVHHQLPELAQTHVHWMVSHPTISSSVIPFFYHLQSFSAARSFPSSQFFASGGQSIGVLASTSVLPMNSLDLSPLGWTGWISLLSKGLSRVLQHHSSKASILWCSAFFIVLNSHIHTWLLEKP